MDVSVVNVCAGLMLLSCLLSTCKISVRLICVKLYIY